MRELSIQELAFVSGGRNRASNGSVIGGNGGDVVIASGDASAGATGQSANSSISTGNINSSGTGLGLNLSL
jgi:hypothetical protein